MRRHRPVEEKVRERGREKRERGRLRKEEEC